MTEKDLPDEIALMQQSWHGWGSPVGVGLGLGLVVASLAAVVVTFRRRPRRP
ncbi:hypothetical protein JQS43_19595 [Natronosporangium hydrolyticum]|uniref:Uncharacterized protein n=1 Tax=Natronosporangium hydrolyticum TaxID=2811111 RepID=A0A895YEB9_9ACTN|nr:hypothetical protein [Natronosporangium hydrolyticum]QSB13749.1 hypothetical protein JQS43_19595 [Natronosporangium hydrolyticum]